MPATLKVKADDPAVKAQREATAQRVLDYFGSSLPPSRLLCFLDDDDPPDLRRKYTDANCGFYTPINDAPLALTASKISNHGNRADRAAWPDYLKNCIYVDDGVSSIYPRAIDDVVYLYGSICANEVGLTMALAHELQHAIQHANARELWALNSLVSNRLDTLKLKWADIPTEVEARIVSKRVAVHFFGEERVTQYIDEKIAEGITRNDVADVADWQFVRTLTASSSVDLIPDTQQLFKRLKLYRSELEAALQEKKGDPDFGDVDLDAYFGRVPQPHPT